jgi:acrylyl-CoA reductase (NADPH)
MKADSITFPGILIAAREGGVQAALCALSGEQLPPGAVLVRVEYSTLNYKDALAICRGAPVVRTFPMVPGVDLAGVVESSSDPRFTPGDAVLANGWGLGETQWGGLARYARLPGDFLLKIPAGLDARRAMAIGTAGYTAMLCLMALERAGLRPERGEVLVTGASGGVGSVAIALLAGQGYAVTASTGRLAETEYLKTLGAAQVIDRAELSAPGKPLQKERWAGAIDSVGGTTLANVCASLKYRGLVAACGLAQGMEFPATVAPFILRGVSLLGIDSVRAPLAERTVAWDRLSRELDAAKLELTAREIGLEQAIAAAADLLAGKVRGRLVVRL